jgi:hypothetical protein
MIAPGLIKRNLLHRFPLLVRGLDLLCRQNRRHSRTNADRRRNDPASGRSGERLYRFWWRRWLWWLWLQRLRLSRCGGLFHFWRFRCRRRWRLRRRRGRLYGGGLYGRGNLRFRCLFFDLRFGFGFGFRFDAGRLRLSGSGLGDRGNLDFIRHVNGHDVV